MIVAPELEKQERQLIFVKLGMHPAFNRLTTQQKLVVDGLAVGRSYEDIGDRIGISPEEVEKMLVAGILSTYDPTALGKTRDLTRALKLIAAEVKL